MDYDEDKVDEAVLALMYLTIHDQVRAWKGFDWDTLNRLHEKGLIANPKNKTKSVVLTEEGLARSEELFERLFSSPACDAVCSFAGVAIHAGRSIIRPSVGECEYISQFALNVIVL